MRKHVLLFLALVTGANAAAQVASSASVLMFYREQGASYLEPTQRYCLALNLKTGDLQVSQSVQTWKDTFQDHVQWSEGIVGQTELNAVSDLLNEIRTKHLDQVAFPDSFHNLRPLHEVTIELLPERDSFGYLDFGNPDLSKLERPDLVLLYSWKKSREALLPLVERLKSLRNLTSENGSAAQMEGICVVGPPADKLKGDSVRPDTH